MSESSTERALLISDLREAFEQHGELAHCLPATDGLARFLAGRTEDNTESGTDPHTHAVLLSEETGLTAPSAQYTITERCSGAECFAHAIIGTDPDPKDERARNILRHWFFDELATRLEFGA